MRLASRAVPLGLAGAALALAGALGPMLPGAARWTAGDALLLALALLAAALAAVGGPAGALLLAATGIGGAFAAVVTLMALEGGAGWGYWALLGGFLLAAVGGAARLSVAEQRRLREVAPPALVPLVLLLVWQGLVIGFEVPKGIFPSVTDVWSSLASTAPVLVRDAYITFVKEVLLGFALGLAGGFLVGTAIAFSGFLQRGFLPLAAAFGAVPIVGMAPVLGRAFGVDWESKAAVVVIVTFFPVVLNTVKGLTTVDPLELELLRAYAARPGAVFLKLRLPNALPYLFNALKLAVVVSVVSVIVAEFLIPGPPEGLGQRISLSARRGAYDVVFAAVAVSSLVSIAIYAAVAALESYLTSWHASNRGTP